MKAISSTAIDALAKGRAIVTFAVKIATASPLLIWGGYGNITLGGETYVGVGKRALCQVTGGQLGTGEVSTEISIDGISAEGLAVIAATDVRDAESVVWRQVFDSSGGSLLDGRVFRRGTVDAMPIKDTPGGTATVTLRIETAARASNRRGARMTSDVDQRLYKPLDGSHKHVAYAGDVTLYVGGKPPAKAAQVLPGAGYDYGGAANIAQRLLHS